VPHGPSRVLLELLAGALTSAGRWSGQAKGGAGAPPAALSPADVLVPVGLHVVIAEGLVARGAAVVAGQLTNGIAWRRLQLLLGIGHYEGVLFGVVVQCRPRQRMVFFADAKQAAEADHGEHDLVVGLFENDVLDLADAVATGVLHLGANDAFGANGFGMSGSCGHVVSPVMWGDADTTARPGGGSARGGQRSTCLG